MAFLKKSKDPFSELQACLQKRDYKGAIGWFNRLLKKDKKNTQIRLRYADTLVLAGSKNEAIRQYRQVADELAAAGFMIRAIAINKKIVQLDPGQSDVHEKLAAMNEERSKHVSRPRISPRILEEPPKRATRSESERSSPAEEPDAAPEPTLSLEESLAMEFGETGAGPSADVESPVAPDGVSPGSSEVPHEVSEEPFDEEEVPEIELQLDEEQELEEPVPSEESVGFELREEPGFSPEPAAPTSLEEAPSFSEEPIAFESAAADSADASEEDFDDDDDVVVIDIDSEPEMAADGSSPLVGLLGEDIDSLIDSIIDDVGSASGAFPAVTPAPRPAHEPPTRIPLFSDLTMREFVEVALMLVRRPVKAGTVIVREGEPGDSMFIVSTGEFEVTRREDGDDVGVATFHDGDFFGEMAVLSGEPRTATVTAVKSSELLELSRENLQQICSRHPEVEAKIRLAYDERAMSD